MIRRSGYGLLGREGAEPIVGVVLPPAHAGRRSSSSGRAVATTSNGITAARSTSPSTNASSASSAQCRSSNTTTVRALDAIAAKKSRHAGERFRAGPSPSGSAPNADRGPT